MDVRTPDTDPRFKNRIDHYNKYIYDLGKAAVAYRQIYAKPKPQPYTKRLVSLIKRVMKRYDKQDP